MQPTIWHAMIGIGLIALFFSIVGTIAYLLYGPGITVTLPDFFDFNTATTSERVATPDLLEGESGVLYACDGEKALKAELSEGSVRLALSDGRKISLPQAVSASGARYANTDESFVFWNKDGSAFVEENGSMTYANCTASMPN